MTPAEKRAYTAGKNAQRDGHGWGTYPSDYTRAERDAWLRGWGEERRYTLRHGRREVAA
jgi:hypothetical protein